MKRYYYIISLLTFACQAASAQTADKNYVMTETMLNSSGTRSIVSVQYYDGLGRPSELAEGGIRTDGKYLHSLTTYDESGRESITTLPAAATSSPTFQGLTPTSSAISQSYGGDSRPFSQTTYDALGRPVFTTTPGDNWTGKGKSINYVTNGANEVKRYKAMTGHATLDGYYPAGSLTGERLTDEDGITVTTYKDLVGRIVLERRGNNDDTYYVYSTTGLLRFILQPMYQESAVSDYRFRYDYDALGRMTYKYLPGCEPIQYWYDGANRLIALREPKRAASYCTRHFFYDGLGRMVIQARSTASGSNSVTPLIATRENSSGATEIAHTGYYIRNYSVPTTLQIEIVNYYDDYAFLASDLFTDSIPSGNFQMTSPLCATTLKTGDITATSDGHLLARVYYYDAKGRVVDTRENLLGGEFLQTTATYSFTDKPLSVQKTLSGSLSNIAVTEAFTYDVNTDQVTAHDITHNGVTTRTAAYYYDNLGRLSSKTNDVWFLGSSFSYNIHGWLTSTAVINFDNNYQNVFSQNLYYETGSGQPCYNGNISAMKWLTAGTGNGYKFFYDGRNRLTEARHTFYDMSDYPIYNSERMSYNRNSAITQLSRSSSGLSNYAIMDSLFYSYDGNLLTSIGDYGTPTNYSGSFEFRFYNTSPTYAYNGAGDLTQDGNKGLTKISYDHLGHPVRVQFRDGSATKYVYAADGRKLREKHVTAVVGLTVQMGQTLELTPAQTMAVDSMDYADNIRYRKQHLNNIGNVYNYWYHFDDGYLAITPFQQAPTAYTYLPTFHYQVRDHQGNVRVVASLSSQPNAIEQKNEYFPYGGPWGDASTNQGFQPYKYNGKELDRVHGLDWYDYGARRYDPAFAQFTQMDPLAEKYPHLSPYAYCAGNPVRYVDPDGRHIRVTKKDGVYIIDGGEVDDDLNIYDVTNGWDNRVSIGEALTQYSFFDDNGKPSLGSVIDLNDQSGQEFWDNFKTWAPIMPLPYYAYHARNGQKYDFKQKGSPYSTNSTEAEKTIYHNRGMQVSLGDGKEFIASARDIGNYAAGYVAGLSGLSWQEARCGFDLYESYKRGRFTVEKGPTQSAQFRGYLYGLKPIGLTRRIIRKAFIR